MKFLLGDPPSWKGKLIVLGGLLACALAVYHPGLLYAYPSPEDFYFFGIAPTSAGDLIHKYLNFKSPWYRPSSFFLTYSILSQFLDWHAVVLWKLVNLLFLVAASFCLYLLILRFSRNDALAALMGSVFFLTHPAVIMPLYEVTAFDFLHLIAAALVVLAYLSSLQARGWRAILLLGLAVALYAFALTLKEVCYPIPFFLAAVSLMRGGPGRPEEEAPVGWFFHGARLFPFFAIFGIYTWLHVLQVPPRPPDSAYRTAFNLSMILENLENYSLWTMRIFFEHPIKDVYIRRSTNGLSMILMGLILLKIISDVRSRQRSRWPAYLLGGAWFLIFLAIPVYSGNYLHHILLPLFGFCLVISTAGSSLIRSLTAPSLRAAVTGVLLFLLAFIVWMYYNAFLNHGVHNFGFKMAKYLMENPLVPKERVEPGTVFYIDDAMGIGKWWFGGEHMFPYLYKDRSIRQVVVTHSGELPEKEVMEFLREPRAYFIRFDKDARFWDASDEIRREFRHLLDNQNELPPVPAARSPPGTP